MAQQQPASSAAITSPSISPTTTDLPSLSTSWVVSSDNVHPAKPVLLHELLSLARTTPAHLTNKSVRLVAPLHSYDAATDTATLATAPGQGVAVGLGLLGGSWRCAVGSWCQVIGECEWAEGGQLVVRARVLRDLGEQWDMKLYEAVLHSRRAWEKRLSDQQQREGQQQQQQQQQEQRREAPP